jgi:hypothetical protein
VDWLDDKQAAMMDDKQAAMMDDKQAAMVVVGWPGYRCGGKVPVSGFQVAGRYPYRAPNF